MIETTLAEIPERSLHIIGVEHYNPESCPVAVRRVALRVNDKWFWFGEYTERGAVDSLSGLMRAPDDRLFVFGTMLTAAKWQREVNE